MKIELDLSSEEAETLVFACALRAKQKGLDSQSVARITEVGQQIALRAGAAFGWSEPEKMLARCTHPIKHVSIKCYDINPKDKP